MKLYEINEMYRRWAEKIEEQDGEVTPEDMVEIEQIEADFTEKAESYAVIIQEQKAAMDMLDAEMDRLGKRYDRYKKTAEWLKERLASAMTENGKDKVETGKFLLSFRKSKRIQIDDEAVIPEEFFEVKRKPMKAEIKKAIEAGQAVAGCQIVEERNLQIR